MGKITRIEDITKIVGIKNYIKALSLNSNKLKYTGFDKKGKGICFSFLYEEHTMHICIDSDRNLYNISCSCTKSLDYCAHIALAIMYLLRNEDLITLAMSELSQQKDDEFNEYLFSELSLPYQQKEQIELEIIMREIYDFEYELQIKIGNKKKYVLNRKLQEFLEVYSEGGKVEFGNNFTYDSEHHTFSETDNKIIEFLQLYLDSQSTVYRNYYGYYTPRTTIQMIKLSKKSLKAFLKLLKNKPFIVEQEYYKHMIKGVEDNYDFPIEIIDGEGIIKLNIDSSEVVPFTSDYEYLRINNVIYHCREYKFIRLLKENKREQLTFKKNELEKFTNLVLPSIRKINQNVIVPETLKEIVQLESPTIKIYLDYEKSFVECHIKLNYKGIEHDMWDQTTKFGTTYILRDLKKEEECYRDVLSYGFVWTIDTKKLVIEEDKKIVNLLENGIPFLIEKYDVYMSKKMKNLKIINTVKVESQFKIGSSGILEFNFSTDGIDKSELSKVFDAIELKKKYYRLKSGDWLNLEDEELHNLSNVISSLDINKKDLFTTNIPVSKYKSLEVDALGKEYDFIKIDNSMKKMIEQFKSYKDTEVNFTEDEKNLLREYQQLGIKWMLTLANCGFGGILADEMGLGKSLQTIQYIEKRQEQIENAKFLIVVPTSLIYNWENEFKKFAPKINYVVINDVREKREKLLCMNYEVYITTYGLLRQDIEMYEKMEFDTCIVDEAQNIKNIQAETTKAVKRIHSENRFALTGTPIENSVLELWSIFDYLMPGFFPNITKFKHLYRTKNIEDNSELLTSLNYKISPFILRRKKKDVLVELPDKIMNNVLVDLDIEQKKLYLSYLEKTKQQIDDTIKKEGFQKSQILILSLLTKLRQICIHPKLIIEDYKGRSAKIDSLLEIVMHTIENGHKILLFSQFPSALRIVKMELENKNIDSYYLDGSTKSKDRMKMVTEFNSNNVPIFLISLKAGGTGLNLTSADVVIHLDPWWNPQVENQATDRSHRIGQKNKVEVIKLIAKGTIEEKIVDLQDKKQKLSEQVIEGENRNELILSKLTEKELKDILNG